MSETTHTNVNAPLLSRDEAAAYLGISVHLLMQMVNDGQVRGYRIGGRYFVSRADLEGFLEHGAAKWGAAE